MNALLLVVLAAGEMTPPTLVTSVEPTRVEVFASTSVPVLITIGVDGTVTEATVSEDAESAVAEAALTAARQLVFTPAMVDGQPVPVRVTYTFVFEPAPVPEPEVEPEPDPEPAAEAEAPVDQADTGYDVTVQTKRPAREVTRRTVERKAVEKMPGGLGDPVRVIENLPGVARTPTGSGDIIVRGSGPQDSGVFIDGMSVPVVFHFGGLRSVIPPQLVERVDFYPGNFGAQYGRYTGGIVDIQLRAPVTDKIHGSADVNLLDASVFAAIPLGERLSLAIGGRRSWIDAILGAALSGSDTVNVSSAPVYYDGQLVLTYRPSQRQSVTLAVLGSSDNLRVLFENPGAATVQATNRNFSNSTSFVRAQVHHRIEITPELTNDLQLAVGRDHFVLQALGLFDFDLQTDMLIGRERLTWKPSSRITLAAGADIQWSTTSGAVTATLQPQEGQAARAEVFDLRTTNVDGVQAFNPAEWIEAAWTVHQHLQLIPSLRIDHFSRLDATTFDPRMLVRVPLNATWTLKAGAGATHQSPSDPNLDPVFGNPQLGAIRAWQYSAGAEVELSDFTHLDVVGFYKDVSRLPSPSGRLVERDGQLAPEILSNRGSGRVYGVEVMAEQRLWRGLTGWLSYTLSRAERTDAETGRTRLFDFDQTHILSAVAMLELPRDWDLGVRWRFVSGNPTTPITGGVFLSDADSYGPISGPTNSDRLPSFHQLDVRLDKTWRYDGWSLSAYLNLTNVYNRSNPEAVSYSFDYRRRQFGSGLPLYPIFGVKAEL